VRAATEEGEDRMSARSPIQYRILVLCLVLIVVPSVAVVAGNSGSGGGGGKWWDVDPEPELPSPDYDSILYSEVAPRLREIELNSNRVKVDVIGRSAGGRNLFLVTVSDPQGMGRLGRYQAIRTTMLKDPSKAQEMIEKFGDFKVPVLINASVHGGEYPGVDAAIRLIETLAYDDSEEVMTILENVILLVNVVHNPDGRVMGTRRNTNGFDIGRDFIAQTQPETRAAVGVMTEWNPMVVLDLHGFVNPMLIEPCTPPHNPNYEYDLYISWALAQAEAMEAELLDQLGFAAQIPYRDNPSFWDDWAPSYVAMYSMYHGAYGHTLETPYRDERGVDALYTAVWGALEFVSQNREAMIHDQIEIFRRGYLDLLQQPVPPELLPVWDQYADFMIQEFPEAYIIPADTPFQPSPHQAARLVDFLLFNDVEVERASEPFTYDGTGYPEGTYVVWLDQPKRGLANTILDDGLDLTEIPGLEFYSPPAAWSHPRLWGVTRAVVNDAIDISTHGVKKADAPQGWLESETAAAYAYLPTSIAAVQATNDLLARGATLHRVPGPFTDSGRDFGAGAIILPGNPELAAQLVSAYALDVFALEGVPADAVVMSTQRIAVYGDEGVVHSLRVMGFDFDVVDRTDLNAGDITGYDVFLNRDLRWSSLDAGGQTSFTSWFAAGGDYVGLGYRGRAVDFAVDAGVIDVGYGYTPGNAIVYVDFDPDDTVAAGFREDGSAFVYQSVWFTAMGAGTEVSARLDSGDFLIAGFWEDWQISGANGMPIVVHAATGDQDTVLIGFDPTFRGHPEDAFRMVASAIYTGLD
jgi:hypothetical protein